MQNGEWAVQLHFPHHGRRPEQQAALEVPPRRRVHPTPATLADGGWYHSPQAGSGVAVLHENGLGQPVLVLRLPGGLPAGHQTASGEGWRGAPRERLRWPLLHLRQWHIQNTVREGGKVRQTGTYFYMYRKVKKWHKVTQIYDTVNRGELIWGGELIWILRKMLKTDVMSTFYCQLSLSFTAKSNDQFIMHSAKKGINMVHCLVYIYFVLKDVFSHRFETSEKSPPPYSKNGRCSEDKMHQKW